MKMLKKKISSLVRKRPNSGRGGGGAGGSGDGERQQQEQQQQNPSHQDQQGQHDHQVQQGQGQVPQHVLIVQASQSRRNITARSANLAATSAVQGGTEESPADPPPPTYEEVFGSPGSDNNNDSNRNSHDPGYESIPERSGRRRSPASSKRDASSNNDSGVIGIEHVAIIKVRSDARPEEIQKMLDATRSLASTVDGVISLSVGKIFVNNSFMDDNTHGLARQNGYALRVRLRDMEAYERWFASEARAALFFEHVVPIMPPDCVPLRIAFESEEISGKGV